MSNPEGAREAHRYKKLPRETFPQWLLKQAKRNDPVGDLAREFRDIESGWSDEYNAPLPSGITPAAFRAYLKDCGICDEDLEAFERARREFDQGIS